MPFCTTCQPPFLSHPPPPAKAPHCCDAYPRNLIVTTRQRRHHSNSRPYQFSSPIVPGASTTQNCHPLQASWRLRSSGDLAIRPVLSLPPSHCARSSSKRATPFILLPSPATPIAHFRLSHFWHRQAVHSNRHRLGHTRPPLRVFLRLSSGDPREPVPPGGVIVGK